MTLNFMDNLPQIQKFNAPCFHNGHYILRAKGIENSLLKIENSRCLDVKPGEEDCAENSYDTADVFLHGSCNLFSLALHEAFGLNAYEMKGADDRCIHCFCISHVNGQEAFIDVRGATTDYQEFILPLIIFPNEQYRIVPLDIEKVQKLENEEDAVGMAFAREILETYSPLYNLK